MAWPFPSSRERLRREAAAWLARLQGPDAETSRAAFDRWYGSSRDRAAAFERIKGSYEAAGLLRRSEVGQNRSLARGGQRVRSLVYGVAAAAVGAAVLVLFLLGARAMPYQAGPQAGSARYAAAGHERHVSLADGSEVKLSTGSEIAVELGPTERRLRLLDGEATFSVAHEGRPFVVLAGATEVVAHGTRFTVRVAGSRTTVVLIEGSVEVTYAAPGNVQGLRRTRHLQPGERLVVDAAPKRPAAADAAQSVSQSRTAMLDFDDTPLSEAVARANARGGPRIRLGNAALGSLRVTGAFRTGDTQSLAESLAAAFSLNLSRAADGTLLLTRTGESRPGQ